MKSNVALLGTRCLFFSILFLSQFQFHVFSQKYVIEGNGGNQDEALDIATDGNGNAYVTGYFTSSVTLGNGPTLFSLGLSDIFITKTSPNGQILWAIKAGGTSDDRAHSIAVDAAGNVYVTGHYQGTADFGGVSLTSNGLKDVFVAKYNTSGILLWVKSAGGIGEDFGSGIAVDGMGNVAVTGEFKNTATFGAYTFTAGGTDPFVCKYNSTGNLLWAKSGSGVDNARGLDVACDAVGNVYATGQFSNDITFDNLTSNNLSNAIYTVKFSTTGTEEWFRKAGGGTTNIAYSITTDANANVYITGDFTGNMIFFPNSPLTNSYTYKIFLAKYSPAGVLQWAKSDASANEASSRSVTVGSGGEVYIGGWFKCKFSEYADEYGQGTFHSIGFKDCFITKYDVSGNWQWARNFGGNSNDYVNGVALDETGLPIAAVSFYENIHIPYKPTTEYIPDLPSSPTYAGVNYCGEDYYGSFVSLSSEGASDFAFGCFVYPDKQPLDFFTRQNELGLCNRNELPICIQSWTENICKDSLVKCKYEYLVLNTNTHISVYDEVWSTPTPHNITSTGYYSATATREDGCYLKTDSVHVTIYPNPPVQQIWDNHGINTPGVGINTSVTPIEICLPDTILITGVPNGVDTFYWSSPTIYSNITDSIIQVTAGGTYYFNVVNSYGCMGTLAVDVIGYSSISPVLNPVMLFPGDTDHNDSLTLCEGELFTYTIEDLNTGPIPCVNAQVQGYLNVPQMGMVNQLTPLGCNINIGGAAILPTQSGWLQVTWNGMKYNYCDSVYFSASDSIYITIIPNIPTNVTWTGDRFLCPGDSSLFTATGPPSLSWEGTNIISTPTPNSVWVMGNGVLTLTANTVSPEGCPSGFYEQIHILVPPAPTIVANPIDALICPNDSVELIAQVLTMGIFYEWFGPQGAISQNSPNIYVTLPGDYYCVVTDTFNCRLFSNTLEVRQYTTPSLLATPSNILCGIGDTVLITVITNVGSNIQWNAPFSGNSSSQVAVSPGTYSATITSCGIVTTTEVTIDISTVTSEIITTDGLIFCDGDSVLLQAAGNNVEYYIWNPGSHLGQQYVVHDAGFYTVTGTDEYGCSFDSSPIQVISTINGTQPPIVKDTIFCSPSALQLTAFGQGIITWFADSVGGMPLDTGNLFQTPILTESTIYYVMNRYDNCSSERMAVTLSPNNCDEIYIPNIFTPNGDGSNDYFTYNILGAKCFEIIIYNRWGVKVFESQAAQGSWNGKVMNTGENVVDGVYFYITEFCPQNADVKKQSGIITIIRD